MLHRINLQTEDPDTLECENLHCQADSFISAMDNPIGIAHRVGLNTTSSVHTYSHSTPVGDLCPSSVGTSTNEYNQFNLQNINSQTLPKWQNNENILEELRKFKWSCI